MILVIGGAFQGKRDFVKEKWKVADEQIYDNAFFDESMKNFRALNGFHNIMKNYILDGGDYKTLAKFIIESGIEIIISNETGCGIVPIDKAERKCREETGRALCEITKHCNEVYRVYCGIPQKIK